jgi:D-alanyl-D-alanine carboxypeptidase
VGVSRGARRARAIASGVVALVIVGGAAYAAAALLSPLPALEVQPRELDTSAVGASLDELVMPEAGASAVALPSGEPVLAGDEETRPMAGVAKLVLAHVALDAEPLEAGRTGETVQIDAATAARYRELTAAGARTVAVLQGQVWTRRDLLAATVIGSGNNIAELLMLEVFGGLDAYTAAAAAWLDTVGLDATAVVDATGLDSGNVSTARDLARLAQLTLAHPVLGELMTDRPRTATAGASWGDEAAYVVDTGAIGLARTYTDAAGVVLLMAVPVVPVGAGAESAVPVALALLGQPGYPRAERAVRALIASLADVVAPTTLVEAGATVGALRSAWGQSASIIARDPIVVTQLDASTIEVRLDVPERQTVLEGTTIGRLIVSTPEGEQVSTLVAGATIAQPGVAWRFADPATVIGRWTG